HQTVGSERKVNAIEPQTDGIAERRRKHVIFAEGEQLAKTRACVTEAGNVCPDGSAGGGLLAQIFLNDVVAVHAVFLAQLEVDVSRALIQRNVGQHTAAEEVKAVGVGSISGAHQVGRRHQRQQALDGWRSYRGDLLRAGYRRRYAQALMLLQPFVGQEEEQLVFQDRTAKIDAEIVAFEGRLRQGRSR